jgi:hypothetical protein
VGAASRNGFSVRSWSDVLAIIAIVSLIVSAVIWGLKLDARSTDHESRLSKLEAEIAK